MKRSLQHPKFDPSRSLFLVGAVTLLMAVGCVPLENIEDGSDAGTTPVTEPGTGGAGGSATGGAGGGAGGSGGTTGEKFDALPEPEKQDATVVPEPEKRDAAPKQDAKPGPTPKQDAAPKRDAEVKYDASTPPPPPPPPPPPVAAMPMCEGANVFLTKCNGCHVGTSIGKVDLVAADGLFERLKGMKPKGGCSTRSYIEATLDADGKAHGVLFDRMTGASCGAQMPLGVPLTDATIACIRDWATAKLKAK